MRVGAPRGARCGGDAEGVSPGRPTRASAPSRAESAVLPRCRGGSRPEGGSALPQPRAEPRERWGLARAAERGEAAVRTALWWGGQGSAPAGVPGRGRRHGRGSAGTAGPFSSRSFRALRLAVCLLLFTKGCEVNPWGWQEEKCVQKRGRRWRGAGLGQEPRALPVFSESTWHARKVEQMVVVLLPVTDRPGFVEIPSFLWLIPARFLLAEGGDLSRFC